MTRLPHARPDPTYVEPGPPFSAKEILRAVPVAVFVVALVWAGLMFVLVPVESLPGWFQ